MHEAGKVSEEEAFDRIMALGKAKLKMKTGEKSKTCFQRAKEGFVRLLGEASAKAVDAACIVANQTLRANEKIVEFKRLGEMVKLSLPRLDKAITYSVANSLGEQWRLKGKYQEAKVILLAVKGSRRVLGEEHAHTLASLNNMGILTDNMEDYEGARNY